MDTKAIKNSNPEVTKARFNSMLRGEYCIFWKTDIYIDVQNLGN